MYDVTDWEFLADVVDAIMYSTFNKMPQSVIDSHRELLAETLSEMITL